MILMHHLGLPPTLNIKPRFHFLACTFRAREGTLNTIVRAASLAELARHHTIFGTNPNHMVQDFQTSAP